MGRATGAVLKNALGIVFGTEAAVETCIENVGDTAFASEEAVTNAGTSSAGLRMGLTMER